MVLIVRENLIWVHEIFGISDSNVGMLDLGQYTLFLSQWWSVLRWARFPDCCQYDIVWFIHAFNCVILLWAKGCHEFTSDSLFVCRIRWIHGIYTLPHYWILFGLCIQWCHSALGNRMSWIYIRFPLYLQNKVNSWDLYSPPKLDLVWFMYSMVSFCSRN